MTDRIEYPGVYEEEGEPPKPIDGVPTTPPGSSKWMRAAQAGAIALGLVNAFRLLRRRRVRRR